VSNLCTQAASDPQGNCTAAAVAVTAGLAQMIQQGTNNVYPEVEGLSLLLGFKTQNAGCCKVSKSGRLAASGDVLYML
jgi:hypothetical protein